MDKAGGKEEGSSGRSNRMYYSMKSLKSMVRLCEGGQGSMCLEREG